MLEGEVLVFKFVAVDGFAAGSVLLGEVTALNHEVGDDAVEDAALVAVSFFTNTESTEVLRRPGDNVAPQLRKTNKVNEYGFKSEFMR